MKITPGAFQNNGRRDHVYRWIALPSWQPVLPLQSIVLIFFCLVYEVIDPYFAVSILHTVHSCQNFEIICSNFDCYFTHFKSTIIHHHFWSHQPIWLTTHCDAGLGSSSESCYPIFYYCKGRSRHTQSII